MNKKVFIGLSGGVDSAVAASILIDQGYNVTGVFLKNWSGEDYGLTSKCPWEEDLESARAVADFLGIELKVYNFEREYRELVIEDFFKQYALGNTPNPDVLCNKFIKFDLFLKRALDEGADYIATGHYAGTDQKHLFKAKDSNKDQTYFLHQLTEYQLSHTIFPLGNLTKPEVRELAKKQGLPNFARKDSQGICFVGKVDIQEFLQQKLKPKEGKIVDLETGKEVGKHNGVWFYTIGQRQGLGIGGQAKPYFVAKKDVKANILYAVQGKENQLLTSDTYIVKDLHVINNSIEFSDLAGTIRYRGRQVPVTITKKGEGYEIKFADKQWAAAVGQSIVVYSGTICIGGGVITEIVE